LSAAFKWPPALVLAGPPLAAQPLVLLVVLTTEAETELRKSKALVARAAAVADIDQLGQATLPA
jgi:hypothetical protein